MNTSTLSSFLASALLAISCLISLHAAAQPALAQPTPAPSAKNEKPAPMVAVKLNPGEVVTMDGTLNAPAWKRAPVFDTFFERDPDTGKKASRTTQVQVLYDDSALYFGVRALDEPSAIREELVRHDEVKRVMDFIVVYIDPIGTKKSSQFFRVAVSGSTGDGQETGNDEDFSPDYDFDAATSKDDKGYTVVLRVPYSSLRFSGDRNTTWRVMVGRRIPRDQFILDLSVPLSRESLGFIDNLQELQGFTPPTSSNFLQLRPTVTARRTSTTSAGQPTKNESELKPSLDLKWRGRPEFVVDATLNPDFSQVELDVPQLAGNTRFALFLNEKRPFFLESSDLFSGRSEVIYTRAVNDPRWGLRATWRSDGVAGLTMVAKDRGGGLTLLPGAYGSGAVSQVENTTVLSRGRVDVGGASIGGFFTHREYENDRGGNTVIGPDLNWNITDSWRVRGIALASRTTALPTNDGNLRKGSGENGHLLSLSAYKRFDGGDFGANIDEVSQNFRSDSGFVTQSGTQAFGVNGSRRWYNTKGFNEIAFFLNGGATRDKANGDLIGAYLNPGTYLSFGKTEMEANVRVKQPTRAQLGGPLMRESYVHVWGQRNFDKGIKSFSTYVDFGQLADTTAQRVRNGVRWGSTLQMRPLTMLELTARIDQQFLRATLPGSTESNRVYTETASQLLGIYHLGPRQTLRLIGQRSSFARKDEPQLFVEGGRSQRNALSLTYTYRQSAGTVLYIGASKGDSGFTPNKSRANEVFIKLQADVDEVRRMFG